MEKSVIPVPRCRFILRHRYAAVLLHVTSITFLLFPSSNAYVLPSTSFAQSYRNSSTQHSKYDSSRLGATLSLRHATLLPPSKLLFLLSRPTHPKSIRLAATDRNEEEDDGWETGAISSNPTDKQQALSSDSSSPLITESPSTSVSPEAELESLRTQIANKRNVKSNQSTSSFATNNNNTGGGNGSPNTEQKRDLFIPIVSVVSLAGLFGAYGYEILRLNLNGELYLPWNQ